MTELSSLIASSTIKFFQLASIFERHTFGFFFFRRMAVAVASSPLSAYGAVVSRSSSFVFLCADSPLSAIMIQSKCNQVFEWMDVLGDVDDDGGKDVHFEIVQPKAASARRVRGVSSSVFYDGFTTTIINLRPSRSLTKQLKYNRPEFKKEQENSRKVRATCDIKSNLPFCSSVA
jgi:hypothetical protein